MRFIGFSMVMAAGVGLVVIAGCDPQRHLKAPAGAENISPTSPPEGNGGTGTGNGLLPETYHDNVWRIEALMDGALGQVPVARARAWLDDLDLPRKESYPVGFFTRKEEQNARLLGDLIGCALDHNPRRPWSAGGVFPSSLKPSFDGEGILTTTAGWWTNPLPAPARVDVHTCMLTRLNAYGRRVPIWLIGDHVAGSAMGGDDESNYTYREAVWLALPEGTGVHLYAWPLQGLSSGACGSKVDEAIQSRICGKADLSGTSRLNNCQVDVSPFGSGCTESPVGHWTCTVKGTPYPAIETRLKQDDWRKVYNRNRDHLSCALGSSVP